MSWTLCTSGSAIFKSGVNVNSAIVAYGTASVKTYLDQLSDEAESLACDLARSNVITNYASLTTNGKAVFALFCEAWVAQNLIMYDMDAIGRSTGTQMMNLLETQKNEAVKIITEDKNKTYLGVAS